MKDKITNVIAKLQASADLLDQAAKEMNEYLDKISFDKVDKAFDDYDKISKKLSRLKVVK